MTGLLGRPYRMNQASYDLARLARNGLITRVPGRNRYVLTALDTLDHLVTERIAHARVPTAA
jgi:hypothetical protein